MTLFFRLLEADDKAAALREVVRGEGVGVFDVDSASFAQLPGSSFAYWVSDRVRRVFVSAATFKLRYFAVRGAYTTDDFRFYRLGWEILVDQIARDRAETKNERPFVPLVKGGSYSAYYGDVHLVLRWRNDGAEPKAFLSAYREGKGWGNDWSACLNGYSHYFRPGLTWSRRTTSGLSLRVMPAACIFADKGPAAFVGDDEPESLLACLAITMSAPFGYLVGVQLAAADAAARSYEVGVIQRTPVPGMCPSDRATLSELARRAWSLKRILDTVNETSHAFLLPALLLRRAFSAGFVPPVIAAELATIQRSIDDISFRLYVFDGEDRAAIEAWNGGTQNGKLELSAESGGEAADDDDGDTDDADDAAALNDADALLSWAVGVAFGRFDHRLATGERPIPPEPEPFDPLPPRSPGMLPPELPPFRKGTGILTDDPGHPDDLVAVVSAVFDLVNEPAPEHLRRTLARDFFPAHLKTYSKSRRKAPIYWQLATPSASYSVWLYLHAMTRDTFYQVQNEVVAPKVAHEERRLEAMRADHGPSPTASQRKELAAQQSLVEELRAFLDEVKRIAPLWDPDLDDGVLLNASPLWRLFPQHKPWQKELKATWDALCAGKYDWAHLAMHLFPERVVPKCAEDRSLAIAHDLEDVFWVEDASGKWKPRGAPTRPIAELVKERTSTAVKSALKALLEAPQAAASPRGRGRRAAGARADS